MNWNIREEGTSFWKREWCPELNQPPSWMEFQEIVRAYDFAGTLPNAQNRDPDWFACVKMGKLKGKNGGYVILDVFRTRIQVGEWSKTIIEIAEKDGNGVTVLIPEDPNPQAKANSMQMAHELISHGLKVRRMKTNQKKVERFATFANYSQNGFVSIVKGIANEIDHVNGAKKNTVVNDNTFFYNELENFDGGRKGHDD